MLESFVHVSGASRGAAALVGLDSVTRLRIRQLWSYTAAIVIVIGGLVAALAQDWRLLAPIGFLSVLVGVVGTVTTLLQAGRNSSVGKQGPPERKSDDAF